MAAHMIPEIVWFILQGVCYAKLVILFALHQNFRVDFLRQSGTVKRRKMGILHSIVVLKMGILHINLNIKMGILNNLHRYLLYTKDLRRDEQTLLLPVMLTMFL